MDPRDTLTESESPDKGPVVENQTSPKHRETTPDKEHWLHPERKKKDMMGFSTLMY